MANVREMKPVGKPSLTDEQRKKLQEAAAIAGDETRGLALALTFRGLVQNHAAQMQETVMTAFALSTKARELALKNLQEWRKELTAAAKGNGNLAKMGERELGRIAKSATVRVSEFTTILRAMDAGMGKDTLALHAGVDDPDNVSFHTIVRIARTFLDSNAAGVGRPADPFEVKLAKWLKKQHEGATGDTLAKVQQAEALLAPILPHEEPAA
jgi:hypothetical protein